MGGHWCRFGCDVWMVWGVLWFGYGFDGGGGGEGFGLGYHVAARGASMMIVVPSGDSYVILIAHFEICQL